jgi:hypothetical protein
VGLDDELWTVYGYGHWYRVAALALACLLVGGLGWMTVAVLAGIHGSAAPLTLGWSILGVRLYVMLVRRPYRLELAGDTIRWHSPLRNGKLPVQMLYTIELESWLRNRGQRGVVFRPFTGRALVLTQHSKLGPFIHSLRVLAPRIEVSPQRWARAIGAEPPSAD